MDIEYVSIALLSLGYQIAFEYGRLDKIAPYILPDFARNQLLSIASNIGGFACMSFAIYAGVNLLGWVMGILVPLLVFPIMWNVLFRITNGGSFIGLWIIFAWIGAPVGFYLTLSLL